MLPGSFLEGSISQGFKIPAVAAGIIKYSVTSPLPRKYRKKSWKQLIDWGGTDIQFWVWAAQTHGLVKMQDKV